MWFRSEWWRNSLEERLNTLRSLVQLYKSTMTRVFLVSFGKRQNASNLSLFNFRILFGSHSTVFVWHHLRYHREHCHLPCRSSFYSRKGGASLFWKPQLCNEYYFNLFNEGDNENIFFCSLFARAFFTRWMSYLHAWSLMDLGNIRYVQ